MVIEICTVILFWSFWVFFTYVRPIVVSDIDDWTYISYVRNAYPIYKNWNPTKVLPETITGIIGFFAVYVIMPICGDYTLANTYCFAFVTALFVTMYIVGIVKWTKFYFNYGNFTSIILAIFFASVHFLIYKTKDIGNSYMFAANDLVCYMNYLVPLIFAFLLFIWWDLERTRNRYWRDYSILKKVRCIYRE